jgi:hypothetical protein
MTSRAAVIARNEAIQKPATVRDIKTTQHSIP